MSLPDFQRQKVYDAEHRSSFKQLVGAGAVAMEWTEAEMIDRVNDYLGILADRFGTARSTCTRVTTISSRSRYLGRAWSYSGQIALQPRIDNVTVMHEAVHLSIKAGVPAHGIEFAESLVYLVGEVEGRDARIELMEAYERYGAVYHHDQREDYTRKRARWAAGPSDAAFYNGVSFIRRREVEPDQRRYTATHGVRRLDDHLLLRDVLIFADGGGTTRGDVELPYSDIAYIWRV